MNNKTRHRGSALLMVVGLLAILLMLGTSFLLISRLSRKEATALAIAAPLNPIAEGLMSEASAAILADLHISTDGFPYDGASEPGEFIDSPWVDDWLSPNDPAETMGGDTSADPDDYGFTRLGSFTPIETDEDDPNADTQYVHVDTDGDGEPDAYLFETGQVDITGRKYYAAIRIVDLSAYINVNVASKATTGLPEPDFPNFYCPTLMDLEGFIPANYADLNAARGIDGITSPYNILNNISLSLLDPGTGYTPFAITDELSLRWLGNKANQRSLTGPLWVEIGNLDTGGQDSKTAQLTTYSVSRALTRRTDMAEAIAPPVLRWLLDDSIVSNSADDKRGELRVLIDDLADIEGEGANKFYKLLEVMTGDATIAGHITANMFAFTQEADYTKSYAFTPTGGSVTYYGVQPDLVISEAYAAHVAGVEATEAADGVEAADAVPGYVGYAIELLNPTEQSITLSNYGLKKQGEATPTAITGGGSLAAGERKVIYYFAVDDVAEGETALTQDEKDALRNLVFGLAEGADFPDWIEMDDVDFRASGVTLTRTAEDETIVVDKVTQDDLGYTTLTSGFPAAGTGEESKTAARDDSLDKGRYNVAIYRKTEELFVHTLDNSNNVAADNEDGENGEDALESKVYDGFAIPTKTSHPTHSLVDLMSNIYTLGPASTDGTAGGTDVFTKQLAEIATEPLRGKVDYATTTNYENTPWPGMLGEFVDVVPPDFYRRDEIVGGRLEELKEYPARVYGRININTASKEVLEQLPWPQSLDVNCDGTTSGDATLNPGDLADLIIDERESEEFFLSTGQISELLLKHVDGHTDDNSQEVAGLINEEARKEKFYTSVRNDLYSSIASSITVRSDTYAVFIMIGLGNEDEDGNPDPENWRTTRRYFGVIDRSNCLTSEDTPATLMFSEVLAIPTD